MAAGTVGKTRSPVWRGDIPSWSKLLSSRSFRTAIGVVVSGLTLYLALRQVVFAEIVKVISSADILVLAVALISVLVNNLSKVYRWKVLLAPTAQKVKNSTLLASFFLAQMLNAVFQIRVGEFSRILVIGRVGVGYVFALGTILIEKIIDMMAYTLLFISLLLFFPLPEWLDRPMFAIAGLTLLLVATLFWIALRQEKFVKLVKNAAKRFPENIMGFVVDNIQEGLSSLEALRSLSNNFKLILSTMLVWGTALATTHLVLLSLGIEQPLTTSLLLLVSLQAGISIPSIPGKIGLFEIICVFVLAFLGVEQSTAFSYGVLLHAIVYLPILLSGLLSYWILDLKDERKLLQYSIRG